jgi:hypothetical protein
MPQTDARRRAKQKAREKAKKRRENAINHRDQQKRQNNKILPSEFDEAIKTLDITTLLYDYDGDPERDNTFVDRIMGIIVALWNLKCNRELWVKKILSVPGCEDISDSEWQDNVVARLKCYSYNPARYSSGPFNNPYDDLTISFESELADSISRQSDRIEQIAHLKKTLHDTDTEKNRIGDKLSEFQKSSGFLNDYIAQCRSFFERVDSDETCELQETAKKLLEFATGLVNWAQEDESTPTDQFDFQALDLLVKECEKSVKYNESHLYAWYDHTLDYTKILPNLRQQSLKSYAWIVEEFGSIENAKGILEMLWKKKYQLQEQIGKCNALIAEKAWYEKVNSLVEKMKNSINKPHDFVDAFLQHLIMLKEDENNRDEAIDREMERSFDDHW